MKRFLSLGTVLCLCVLWAGCGETFRPIIFPNPPQYPNPQAGHTVITISDNGDVTDGASMVIDVSGDSVSSTKNVGLNPVHAAQQSADQVLVVNQSNAQFPQDTVTKLDFSGTTIGATSTITLPPSYDGSGNIVSASPNFVASTEANQAYVSMPNYQPPNQNFIGGTVVPSIAVINTQGNSIVGTIQVGNNPIAMVETPDGNKLYVANQADATITAINTVDRSPRQVCVNGTCASGTSSPPLASPPIWIVARSDSQRAYVLEANGTLAYIDTSSTSGPDQLSETYSPLVQVPSAAYMWYDTILNRVYIPYQQQLAIIDASQAVPAILSTITVPSFNVAPAGSAAVAATAIGVTSLPDGSRAYVASVPSTTDMVIPTQLSISSVSGDGMNATYIYSLASGHDVVQGATITITGTGQTGFDGTFQVASVLSGTSSCATTCFQVLNTTTLNATTVSASATGVNNIFPQITVVNTVSNTIKTTIALDAFQPYDAFCSPTQNPQAPRFRFMMAAGGDSSRAYLSSCDGGNISIVNTTDDNYAENIAAPTSARSPVPPSLQNPPQNPVYMIAGP